jgi:hypothetical protein
MRPENSDRISFYMLQFQSPDSSWQSMCGVEGHYFIDPDTLRALLFEHDARIESLGRGMDFSGKGVLQVLVQSLIPIFSRAERF